MIDIGVISCSVDCKRIYAKSMQLPVWISQQAYLEDQAIAEYAELEQKINKVKIWTAELDIVLMKDQLREIEVWKQYVHWHGCKHSVSPCYILSSHSISQAHESFIAISG